MLVIRFKISITPHRKGDVPVKGVLKDVLEIIKNNPGIQKIVIAVHVDKSEVTILKGISNNRWNETLLNTKALIKLEAIISKNRSLHKINITEPVSIP